MNEPSKHTSEQQYWTRRYSEENTGWNIGYPSTPIKEYIDQLKDKNTGILIPGAGNAYEAEYLHLNGFKNVTVLDISATPLHNLKSRVPSFPEDRLAHQNFFDHNGYYDLILEQTFFCSLEPTEENRSQYFKKMAQLLKSDGKLAGLWFKHPLVKGGNRPFGGNKEEYLSYSLPFFTTEIFEDCYNSIPSRMGNELFGVFKKK